MLPVRPEKCIPTTHPIPDIYEESDNFVSTGQGERFKVSINAYIILFAFTPFCGKNIIIHKRTMIYEKKSTQNTLMFVTFYSDNL